MNVKSMYGEIIIAEVPFPDQRVRCAACDQNEGRYITVGGRIMCGTCPIRLGLDSIKIGDVPVLLAWCREVLRGGFIGGSSFEALRKIVGVVPEGVHWPILEDE